MPAADPTARRVPASSGQRLLWFLDRRRGHTGALNCPVVCRVRGPADDDALAAAVDFVAARHESLRTTFSGAGPRLTQEIHDPCPAPAAHVDLRASPDREDAARRALAAELATRVDPETWPVRVTIWRVGEADRVLCVNVHHLVTDTWSNGVLFRELVAAYARNVGPDAALGPVGWQYAQFATWQRRRLESGALARHEAYWRDRLAGVRPAPVPFAPRGADDGRERAGEHDAVDAATGARLRALARTLRTTPFAVMLAIHYTVLHRLTGERDLAVASLFANRGRREVERTIGFLTNLVVLRTRVPEDATFVDVVARTRATVVDAFAHHELPYHLVPRPPAPAGAVRVDEHVFQMLAEPIEVTARAGDVEFEQVMPDVAGRFELELALAPRGPAFATKLYYTPSRLEPSWARAFVSAYAATAAEVAGAPAARIDRLPLGV